MIPDAELQQMRADAERMQALREKATPGPWLRDIERPRTILAVSGGLVGGVLYNTNGGSDADFIAASIDDPSAANVLRLVEENRRLRQELGVSAVRVDNLRTRLHDQTAMTQQAAQFWHRRVVEKLESRGVVPDGLDVNGHPIEQVVGTCLDYVLSEVERLKSALESAELDNHNEAYNGDHHSHFRGGE